MPFSPVSNILPLLGNKAVPGEELQVYCFSIVFRYLKRKDCGLCHSGMWGHSHPSQLRYCLKRKSHIFWIEPEQLKTNTCMCTCMCIKILRFLLFFKLLASYTWGLLLTLPEYLLGFPACEWSVKAVFIVKMVFTWLRTQEMLPRLSLLPDKRW